MYNLTQIVTLPHTLHKAFQLDLESDLIEPIQFSQLQVTYFLQLGNHRRVPGSGSSSIKNVEIPLYLFSTWYPLKPIRGDPKEIQAREMAADGGPILPRGF